MRWRLFWRLNCCLIHRSRVCCITMNCAGTGAGVVFIVRLLFWNTFLRVDVSSGYFKVVDRSSCIASIA